MVDQKLKDQIEEKDRQIAELVEALEFYAEADTYDLDREGNEWDFSEDSRIFEDGGSKAINALSKHKSESE